MSVLSRRTDFLAPSKILQDAKEKLGPLYYNAKLIECPQNAVELTKLVQQWDELDRQKFKAASESKREQRKLLLALNKKHRGQKSSPSIDRLHEEDDVKLPPPGFRFHTNGEPKAKSVTEFFQILSPGSRSHSALEPEDSSSDLQLRSVSSSSSKILDNDIPTIDYEKQIKVLEKVVHSIEDDLASVSAISTANSKSSKNYLRAHSKSDVKSIDILPQQLTFSHPNERFAFQPGASTFGPHTKRHLHKRELNVPNQAKCIACQFKLKHSSVDFKKLQSSLNKPTTKRWQIAPRGKYTESSLSFASTSPTSSARLSTSGSPRLNTKTTERNSQNFTSDTSHSIDISAEQAPQEIKRMDKTKSTPATYTPTLRSSLPRATKSAAGRQPQNKTSAIPDLQNTSKLDNRSEVILSVWSSHSRRCMSATSNAKREETLSRLKQQLELEKEDCAVRVNNFLKKTNENNSVNSNTFNRSCH